jgi:Cu(I)/Ag(I) efflux system membrane fusion protein
MLESAKLKLTLLGINSKEISTLVKNKKSSPNTTIYSPVDGYVFFKSINNGSAFNAKQKLFEIVNLDKIWVEVKVFEEHRSKINQTKKYELNFKGLDRTYTSNKKLLYPELKQDIASLTLRLHVENKGHQLFPGMYANVTSLTNKQVQLTLPTTAVIRKDSKFYVFIVGEFKGEYEPRAIKAKQLDTDTYKILDGLRENDEVVNNALFMLDSDAQINGLY